MICLSIGTNCVPKAQIENYYIQKNITKPKVNFLFDYTYQNFRSVIEVIKIMESNEESIKEEDFIVLGKTYLNTKLKVFMPHEKHVTDKIIKTAHSCVEVKNKFDTYDKTIPCVVNTYINKINLMKETIKTNDKILFIHYVSEESIRPYQSLVDFITEKEIDISMKKYLDQTYMNKKTIMNSYTGNENMDVLLNENFYVPQKEHILEFFDCIKKINNNTKSQILFLFPPETMEFFDRSIIKQFKKNKNVHFHFLTKSKDYTGKEDEWKKCGYDWNSVFVKIDKIELLMQTI